MIREGGIIEAAMRLREQAPENWELFVQAVRVYSGETSMAMVTAPDEKLRQAQGRAQGLQDLTKLLIDAPKIFEKARNRPRLPNE